MGLTMGERRALTEQVARRYRSAARKDKTVILGEFVEATGYTRKYAIHLLNSWGRALRGQCESPSAPEYGGLEIRFSRLDAAAVDVELETGNAADSQEAGL